MTLPGWYGAPGDPAHERYWDGKSWGAETRASAIGRRGWWVDPTDPARECWHDGTQWVTTHTRTRTVSAREFGSQEPPAASAAASRPEKSRSERISDALERAQRRPGDVHLTCPHCQTKGRVTSRIVRQKKGISGSKATGAILTGGISMLGTGLSRKEKHTEMTCHNCQTKWVI